MNQIGIAIVVGLVLVTALIFANDFRLGAEARRKGWFVERGFGPGARAGWRWQDRRLRHKR